MREKRHKRCEMRCECVRSVSVSGATEDDKKESVYTLPSTPQCVTHIIIQKQTQQAKLAAIENDRARMAADRASLPIYPYR